MKLQPALLGLPTAVGGFIGGMFAYAFIGGDAMNGIALGFVGSTIGLLVGLLMIKKPGK